MMLQNFSILAALVIFATLLGGNAEEVLDPEKFIKDSMPALDAVREQCQVIADDLENIYYPDPENKEEIASQLKICGQQLHDIASKAAIFDVTKIEDIEHRETIKKLQNIEELYKLGEDLLDVGSNWKPFVDAYAEEDIEHYEDSDSLYSLKEIDEGYFITRTEDVNEINYYWSHVADKVGVFTWANFFEFVNIVQKKAKEYNMTATEFWYPNYSEESMAELESIMNELKPFYEQLHAYIRFKLWNRYGSGVIKPNGPIPESLFQQIEDNIWSSENHYEEDFPLSNLQSLNGVFEENAFDTKKIMDMAEKFYESIGFDALSEEYMKEHINFDEDGDCAEDFNDRHAKNVTFNYCSDVTFNHFLSFHEYFGRIHSAILQKDAHWIFWGDNAWGETIGRAAKLSALSRNHIEQIELLPEGEITDEVMNTLNLRLAYMDLFMLARNYVNLRVITDYFANKVEKDALNKHYWKLFEEYAGVEPPIDRTEESLDLPYGLIREVFENRNLIRDFKTTIHVFEVYKAACHMADYTGPMHDCDFYGNKKVGEAFKKILITGFTKPFNLAIETLIPSYTKSSAEALLSYFEPTFDWMKKYNKKHNLTAGWDHSKKALNEEALTDEEEALKFVEEASTKIYKLYDQIASDLYDKKNTDEKFENEYYGNVYWKVSKAAEAASELTEISMKASQFDSTKFKSKPLKKAIAKLTQVADVFVLGEDMETFVYNKQRLFNISLDDDIDKYKDDSDEPATVAYNPYILNVFRTSKDAAELKYYWDAWRDRNGAFAKSLLLDIFKSFETAANKLEISTTDFWFKHYSNDYLKKMEKVIDSVRPFYEKLHYYVYKQLLKKYSEDDFSMKGGSIPDHFVQQVSMQIWTNESIVEDDFPLHKLPPYEQGFDSKEFKPLELLKSADEFYKSLGLEPLEESFWSERVKPEEGSAADGNCHATIYDMTPKVYMKYCERVSFRKFLQAHGYMGRVYYAAAKKELPAYHFDSYDLEYPVGEAIVLSAASPKHAQKLGFFTTDFAVTDEVLLNRLIRMAIHTMFNLHRYFVHTKVVSEYLEGEIEENELAKYYWKYMITYAGIEPPSDRKDDAFDFPFEFYTDLEQNHQIKKFTAEVLGYRIYERLCKLSGHEGDLNNCDFDGSAAVGDALKSMMKLGSSLPRNTVLKRLMQDVSGLNGSAMLNYYAPLKAWLKKYLGEEDVNSFDSYRQHLHAEYFA